MISLESLIEKGEKFRNQVIQIEVQEYDKLLQTHMFEFKLSLLDRVYKMSVKPEDVKPENIEQIWTEIFSTFLSELNFGAATLEKQSQKRS